MPNPNGNVASLTPWGPNNPPPLSPGRPRKRPQTEASDELLRMELPEEMRQQLNTILVNGRPKKVEVLKKGATFADAIAYGLGKKAMQGDPAAAKELADRVEGKPVQRVELHAPEDRGFEVKVTFEMPASPRPAEKRIEKPIDVVAKEIAATVTDAAIAGAIVAQDDDA